MSVIGWLCRPACRLESRALGGQERFFTLFTNHTDSHVRFGPVDHSEPYLMILQRGAPIGGREVPALFVNSGPATEGSPDLSQAPRVNIQESL